MAINYTIVERRDPRDITSPVKFYAQAKSAGEMSLRKLAKRISSMSTVSTIDTLAVLEALLQVIPEELAEGNIVRLGDFGSFFTTVKSGGADVVEDFNDTLIRKTTVRFRPGREVKNTLNNVVYSRMKLN